MEYIENLQTTFADAFITLPLLLIGFSFFFGTLTSNTGLLYLFLGQVLVVPALSLVNNTPVPWMDGETKSYLKLAKWFLSVVGLAVINFAPFNTTSSTIVKYVTYPLLLIGQLILLNKVPAAKIEATGCSIVPGISSDDIISSRPSTWLTHIVFLLSFVFSNAIGIYSEPTPQILNTKTDVDQETTAKQQKKLDERVSNRKLMSACIACIAVIFLILFVVLRYTRTACEGVFLASLPGLILTALTGSSFYTFIYSYCGVRPADVLGIVQGMLNPELMETPIVCVGS